MSCLSERERAALEDIFLSISVNESPYEKCKNIYANFSPYIKAKANYFTHFIKSRKQLKSYTYAKHFLRNKRERLGKHLPFSRHK
jgi:hypothetical protein